MIAMVLFCGLCAQAAQFKVGYAERDVTPSKSVPMWGYGGLGPRMSNGIIDPLYAKGVVIDVGDHKLAIMGLDIGRGPRPSSMSRIRKEVKEKSGVDFVMISGSHTHHGPVTELKDEPEKGRGKYDDDVNYAIELETKIIEAINEAAATAKDAKLGWGSVHVPFCRNRHTKIEPKPVDDELSVIRFDDELTGKTIALVINFSAHPTILPAQLRMFSAEWPGRMKNNVNAALGTHSIFMQGSAGDLSPNTTQKTDEIAVALKKEDEAKAAAEGKPLDPVKVQHMDIYKIEAFGRQVAEEVVKLAKGIQVSKPEKPSIQGLDEDFAFELRKGIDINDPQVKFKYTMAFFPELVNNFKDEIGEGKIHPHLTTIVLDGELALVGGSGEFFCNHSNRLKQRARIKTLFFGYCNGHHMYFPTIEAAAEGGYGGDPTVSWVQLGAGEEMTNRALINIYTFLGKYEFKLPGGP